MCVAIITTVRPKRSHGVYAVNVCFFTAALSDPTLTILEEQPMGGSGETDLGLSARAFGPFGSSLSTPRRWPKPHWVVDARRAPQRKVFPSSANRSAGTTVDVISR
jgi:hypothetical protein